MRMKPPGRLLTCWNADLPTRSTARALAVDGGASPARNGHEDLYLLAVYFDQMADMDFRENLFHALG
jgi:hypothetical protein